MRHDTNPLKVQYPIIVRIAGLSGIGIVITMFLVFPRFIAEAGFENVDQIVIENIDIPQTCLLYTSPSPRD